MDPSFDLDPAAIRRQFDRRAQGLAGADFLLREVERRMLARLDVVRLVPERFVDIGSGLGRGLLALRQRYPQAESLGIDLSPRIAAAAARLARPPGRGFLARLLPGTRQPASGWVAAHAGALPLADASVALAWSNLVLHWCADPIAVLREWHRVLRDDGLLMFSAFGVDSLREMRAAGAEVMRFHDMHDIGDWLLAAGFAEPVMDMEWIDVSFPTPTALLGDLHALGGDARIGRRRGLAGRGAHDRLRERLQAQAGDDGRIGLRFEIVYGHAWRVRPRPRAAQAPIVFDRKGRP
ncbi:MAG: methyltransferase domain-containing protein [Burkholderiaceae bacterium]